MFTFHSIVVAAWDSAVIRQVVTSSCQLCEENMELVVWYFGSSHLWHDIWWRLCLPRAVRRR